MDTKKTEPHYTGHRKRLKSKFSASGFDNFADYEVLELALSFALPRKDTKPIAKQLIKKFGSLKQVFDAKEEDLMSIKGISEHSALFISFLKKFAGIYSYLDIKDAKALSSPETVVNYLISVMSGEKIEKFYAVLLNSGNKVIDCLEIEQGTVNKSVVIPRKIAEKALKFNASAVIIAHNHPGGTLKPSQQDIDATAAVKNALAAVDVALLDHIIVCVNDYFSFKEYNLI